MSEEERLRAREALCEELVVSGRKSDEAMDLALLESSEYQAAVRRADAAGRALHDFDMQHPAPPNHYDRLMAIHANDFVEARNNVSALLDPNLGKTAP